MYKVSENRTRLHDNTIYFYKLLLEKQGQTVHRSEAFDKEGYSVKDKQTNIWKNRQSY